MLLSKIKNSLVTTFKILSLSDVRPYFSKKHYFKMFASICLNIVNTFAKILAPAAFGTAVEMLATSRDNVEIVGLRVQPQHLFYISLILTTWSKAELFVKNLLLQDLEIEIVKQSTLLVVNNIHKVPLDQHLLLRPKIAKNIIDILNTQGKVAFEVSSVITQVLFDVIVGIITVWARFGKVIGVEFLVYSFLEILFLNSAISTVTGYQEKVQKSNKILQKFINREYEALSYEEMIRMFNHEDLEISISEKLLLRYLETKEKVTVAENVAALLKLVPLFVASVIIIAHLAKTDLSLDDIDEFIFLLGYVNVFCTNVGNLSQAYKSCDKAINSFSDMRELLKFKPQEYVYARSFIDRPIFSGPGALSPEITFENVSFSYPNSLCPQLKNISFRIKPGSKIGIVGKSSAGKSTLVKLLYGMYQPQEGSVKLNGHEIKNIPKEILSKIFCVVPQHVEVFRNESLKYNVLYGSPNRYLLQRFLENRKKRKLAQNISTYETFSDSKNDIETSSVNSEAEVMFREAMNKVKLETLVNKVATDKMYCQSLSGGQQQRVGLARAIIRNSSIYVLDEPSAALDSFTESEVLENIEEVTKHKTKIMITHRLSTIQNVDEVYVIEEGRLVEHGVPKELLAKKGVYYNYWKMQSCSPN